MQKFILTGVFLLLLTILIQYPFPILEHEYLIEEYQITPIETQIKKTHLEKQVSPKNFAELIELSPEKIKEIEIEEASLALNEELIAKIE